MYPKLMEFWSTFMVFPGTRARDDRRVLLKAQV